jgi:hypothetical protein
MKITKKQAATISIPRWPQMLVTGKPVSTEQAKEIIFATDSYLNSIYDGYGNYHNYSNWFQKITGYEKINNLGNARWDMMEVFRKINNSLELEYLSNNWVMSSYIYGPHGWCHPDGTISYEDNVGKWPSFEELFNEWSLIATKFTFLDLWVTFVCIGDDNLQAVDEPDTPLFSLYVHNGKVTCHQPNMNVHKDMHKRDPDKAFEEIMSDSYESEHGLSEEWVVEFANRVYPLVEQVLGTEISGIEV